MAKKTHDETTAIAINDEQLRKFAEAYAETERSTSTGAMFGLKGGILTYDGATVTDNKMCVIILDSVLENVYFPDAFDPEVVMPPKCYAFGRAENEMTPHELVVQAGHAQAGDGKKCSDCRHNVFGSADVGKGKACGNRRRLALIPAGTFKDGRLTVFTKPDQFSSPLAYLKLPVTSVKDYSAYVKQLSGALGKPPFAVMTTIAVVPDAKTQFKVQFNATQELDGKLIPTILRRHEEAKNSIMFPYPAYQTPEAVRPAKKPAAKKGRKY